MNLDDLNIFRSLDSSGTITRITGLTEQLELAFARGLDLPLPAFGPIQRVIVIGKGVMLAGADCLAEYAQPILSIPLTLWRAEDLPGWAQGAQTLAVIIAEHGHADALPAVRQALKAGCQVICIGADGPAANLSLTGGGTAWVLPSAWCDVDICAHTFALLYRLLERQGMLPDPEADLRDACAAMRQAQAALLPEVVVTRNPAKRLAGQIYGRWVMLFAGDHLAPVARHWKNRFHQAAKVGGQFELIPEADYNTLAGLEFPSLLRSSLFTVFFRGSKLNPNTLLRLDLARETCLQAGLNTDFVNARGESRLAQMWTAMLLGEFTAYYLAMANGVDPSTAEVLDYLQVELAARRENQGL